MYTKQHSLCETKNIQKHEHQNGKKKKKKEFTECVMADSAHLEHSNIRAVWCGGQVAATRHRVVRRLHIQLASQDTFVIELLLAHRVQRTQVSLAYTVFYR